MRCSRNVLAFFHGSHFPPKQAFLTLNKAGKLVTYLRIFELVPKQKNSSMEFPVIWGNFICLESIFKFSMKNDFLNQTLPLPKNHIKIFKNQKSNTTSQTPIQYTTFHQYTSFTKYLCLLWYGDISTFTPYFFHTSKFDLFDLRNPKIQICQILSSHIIPNLKGAKRAQKIPNQSSSWPWNCCTHTFGRRCCL